MCVCNLLKFLKIQKFISLDPLKRFWCAFFFVGSEKDWNKLKLYFWKYSSADSVDFRKNRVSENCIFYGILCVNEKISPNKMCFVFALHP
jgi:hypothetical protein